MAFAFSGCSLNSEPPPALLLQEGPAITQRVVTFQTRRGAVQRLLIVEVALKNRGTVVLFPGGDGTGSFREIATGFRLSNNFLVRSAHLFARAGYVAAVVDAPSDLPAGMSDGFRTGSQHLQDIRDIINALDRLLKQPLILIGTSRGTLSAAFAATALDDARIKGIVLTASYDYLESLDLESIRYPVLIVHHRDDECRVSSYATAKRQFERLRSSARKEFATITGGDRPISGPCRALSAHGFLGKENEAVSAIASWLAGEQPR